MRSALIITLYFAITLFPCLAMASRPDWIDRFLPEDSTTKYYVGRATSVPSDADAVFQATTDARKQAIGENFGVYVNFQSQSHRSLDTLSATQSAQELSGQVRLEGFAQKDIYFERDDGKVNAWVLFQYPKAEAAKEKVRLEMLRAKQGDDVFKLTDYGSVTGENMGMLEIHSHPEGLPVRIDTHADSLGRELRTPLRIGLDVGHHIVMIDDPKYKLHQEEVGVLPGTTAAVDAVMELAYGTLQIKTEPGQATVSIGAMTVKSPTKKIKVQAGVPILIQINHPEVRGTSQEEITVARDYEEIKHYSLDLRPALVSVSSIPDGAEIGLDGQRVGTTPSTIEISAHVNYHLTLYKMGYEDITGTLHAQPGGGTTILDPFELKKGESQRVPASIEPANTSITSDSEQGQHIPSPSWALELDIVKAEVGGPKIDASFIDLSIERRFFGRVGARVGVGLLGFAADRNCLNQPSGSNSTTSCTKWFGSGSASAPIYLLSGDYRGAVNTLAIVPGVESLRGGDVDNRGMLSLEYSGKMLLRVGASRSFETNNTSYFFVWGVLSF